MPDQRIWHRRIRLFLLVLLPLLMAALFAVVLRQAWTGTGADARLVADQRRRVAYLRPLTHLVSTLVEARSAAVQGTAVDVDAVQAAVNAMDAVDGRYQDALG